MKIYKIPEHLKTVIFDIDGTLYTSPEYLYEQVDVQIRHYAHINGMQEDKARKLISDYRDNWSKEHDGKKISLGNTLTAFGISIEESIKWRNSLMEPQKFLTEDKKLKYALSVLDKDFNMICVTNNPVQAASKTLKVLGIDNFFTDRIIGLDTCYKSKPAVEVLQKAMELTCSTPQECLSIGDRYDIDLSLPLKLGMGAILVDGAEDLYNINCVLSNNKL